MQTSQNNSTADNYCLELSRLHIENHSGHFVQLQDVSHKMQVNAVIYFSLHAPRNYHSPAIVGCRTNIVLTFLLPTVEHTM